MPNRYSSNSPCSIRVVDRLALPNTHMFLSALTLQLPYLGRCVTFDKFSILPFRPLKCSRENDFRQAVHEVADLAPVRIASTQPHPHR
jgi:hypothetical protein